MFWRLLSKAAPYMFSSFQISAKLSERQVVCVVVDEVRKMVSSFSLQER